MNYFVLYVPEKMYLKGALSQDSFLEVGVDGGGGGQVEAELIS